MIQLRNEFKAQFRDPADRFHDLDVNGALLDWLNIGALAFEPVVQLVPFRQNVYINLGTSGVGTAMYEGALDIDTMDQITALIIRAFS